MINGIYIGKCLQHPSSATFDGQHHNAHSSSGPSGPSPGSCRVRDDAGLLPDSRTVCNGGGATNFHGTCSGGLCAAPYLASDCTSDPPLEVLSPCIFQATLNGVCIKKVGAQEQPNQGQHPQQNGQAPAAEWVCKKCASEGCGRDCYDSASTGYFSRGVPLACSKLRQYCSANASIAAGVAVNNLTISAVQSVCRASCNMCAPEDAVRVITVDQLDPYALPPPTMPSPTVSATPGTRTIPTSAAPDDKIPDALTASGDRTKLGCNCRKEWTVHPSLCSNNGVHQWYSGCGMVHPCDGDSGSEPSWWSWCYTVRHQPGTPSLPPIMYYSPQVPPPFCLYPLLLGCFRGYVVVVCIYYCRTSVCNNVTN